MKNILFLVRSLNYGGAERQLVALARGFHKREIKVGVAVFYPDGPLERDLNEAGVSVFSLNKAGRWDVLGFLWRLWKLLREQRPEILHGYLVVPNLLTILFKPLFPGIRMVWGVRDSQKDWSRYDRLSGITFRLSRRLACFADLIIVNSRAGADFYSRQGYLTEKMAVIPNGIDTTRFYPDPSAGARMRQAWGFHDAEQLIGLVGRLAPMKGHPTFLKAAALLVKERPDIRFVCVGDGPEPYKSELHALGKKLGLDDYLIWPGNCADMNAVYSAFNIASSSSYGEGFSNVIGEAMACGVPCVVTDVGDSAWIVGDTGVVVPVHDIKALTSAWKQLIECSVVWNRSRIRQSLLRRFGVEELVKRTEKALWLTG